ncbi:MAG: 4Fe-4S dicluster domain-containing protein [Candidatus Hodarchaeota archaeon]
MGKGKIPDYDSSKDMITGILEFDDEKCNRCGTCASICPGRSIIIPPKQQGEKRGIPYLDELVPGVSLCMGCGDCLAACPNGAITVKRGFTVKEGFHFRRLSQDAKLTFPKKY